MWILTNFAYKNRRKEWLDFGDLDLIFKLHHHFECQILTQNSFSAPYLLNQMMDSGQTLCIVLCE